MTVRRGPYSAIGLRRADFSSSDVARFRQKVDRRGPSDCWPWLASQQSGGYGQFTACSIRLGPIAAHRVAFTLASGGIPEGVSVLHSCDNPRCVNPSHLRAGLHFENVQDCIAKGRAGFQGSRQSIEATCRQCGGLFHWSGPRLARPRRYCGHSCALAAKQDRRRRQTATHQTAFDTAVRDIFAGYIALGEDVVVRKLGNRDACFMFRAFGLFGRARASLTTIGKEAGVSRERARQIVNRATTRLAGEAVVLSDIRRAILHPEPILSQQAA